MEIHLLFPLLSLVQWLPKALFRLCSCRVQLLSGAAHCSLLVMMHIITTDILLNICCTNCGFFCYIHLHVCSFSWFVAEVADCFPRTSTHQRYFLWPYISDPILPVHENVCMSFLPSACHLYLL